MSEKILFTADLHFHNYKNASKRITMDNILDVIDQAVEYCLKNNIKRICILGDLFHIRGKIIVSVFNRVHDKLEEVAKKGIKISLLSGNHDHVYNEAEKTSAVYSLQKIEGVELLDWEQFTIGNCDFVAVPYISKRSNFESALGDYARGKSKYRILLTHGLIRGSMVGGGRVLDMGLDDKTFDDFDKVLSGHVHHPQKLCKGKVCMLGSPLCHDKKDMNSEDRGFWVLDCESASLDFVPTTYSRFVGFSVKSFEEIEENLATVNKGDFIYLSISESIDDLDKLLVKFKDYNIEYSFTYEEKPQLQRLDTSLEDSEEKIVQDYIDKYGEDFDKSFLTEIATELIEEYSVLEAQK